MEAVRFPPMHRMNFAHFSATLATGIFIGGSLVWWLKPKPETPERSGNDSRLEITRSSRTNTPETPRFAAKLQALIDRELKIDRDDPAQDSAYLEALAVALLKSGGGYGRLKQEEQQVFSELIDAMAEKNLERTLDWIDQSIEEEQRARNYRAAIQTGMKDAPVRELLDLFKGRDFTPEEVGQFAGSLMMGHESMSTETALYLLGHVQLSDSGRSGGYALFDRNFDYAEFADSILQTAKANKNRVPNAYPMNLLSEWTRSDPQAAASFYLTHCIGKDGLKLPFTTLETFMKDLHANIPETDYAQFAAAALSQQLLAAEPDITSIDELLRTGFTVPNDLAESLNRIPDPAVREKRIIDSVSRAAESSVGQQGGLMQLRGALSLYSDPITRLGSIERYGRELSEREGDRDREATKIIRNLCNQLAILGHPEADLQRIRNAAGQYGR